MGERLSTRNDLMLWRAAKSKAGIVDSHREFVDHLLKMIHSSEVHLGPFQIHLHLDMS
jgi:hypothetical protein